MWLIATKMATIRVVMTRMVTMVINHAEEDEGDDRDGDDDEDGDKKR